MYGTNQSSLIIATITVGAVCLYRSQVIYVRGILSLSVSADIEDSTTTMKDGTNLDFVISDNSRECCVFIRIVYIIVTLYIVSIRLVLS